MSLKEDYFWSCLRSDLFKKINQGPGSADQWLYIVGKKNRDKSGKLIKLSRKNEAELWGVVEYLNGEEGLEELRDLGITDPPQHIDDLMEIIRGAKVDRAIKADMFRAFLKYKHRIMDYLATRV